MDRYRRAAARLGVTALRATLSIETVAIGVRPPASTSVRPGPNLPPPVRQGNGGVLPATKPGRAWSADRLQRRRGEGPQFLLTVPDDDAGRLRHLPPGAAQIPQRLGDDQSSIVGDVPQQRIVRVLLAQGGDVGAVEQRPGPASLEYRNPYKVSPSVVAMVI